MAHVAHAREQRWAGLWTGVVDLVHGFTVHRLHKGEGLRVLGHRFHDVRLRCSTGGGSAASGGARRCFTGVPPATIQNGFQGMVLSMEGLYMERGTRRTYLDGRRGGSGGHGGSQRKGAATATPVRKGRRGGAVCARQPEGRGSSPCCDTPREENDDGKATAR
jgi:hypothetical protein